MLKRKLPLVILLSAAILAILLLAASLGQVRLPPGEPFTLRRAEPVTPPAERAPAELSSAQRLLLRVGLILTLTLLPFSIFYLLISAEARKRFIRNLIVFGVLMLIMSSLGEQLRLLGEGGLFGGLNLSALFGDGAASQTATGQPAEFTSQPPDWAVILTSFLLAAAVVGLAAGLIYAFTQRSPRPREAAIPLAQIAEQAESAVTAITAGEDPGNTVIRCYVAMSQTVRAARGIARQREVTPREFEEQLVRAGLPSPSVRELTRIFETVRYGGQAIGAAEEAQALASLAAIADACRNARKQ